MKKNKEKKPKENPVREGQHNSSVADDPEQGRQNEYPRDSKKDIQHKNQPEFTENGISGEHTKENQ